MAWSPYQPFIKTVAATLAGSAEIVLRDAVGALTPERVDAILQQWQERVFRSGAASVEAFGAERYADAAPPSRRAYVVMTNHQSLLDVPSVVATWPGRIRMVAKEELGRVPVWGAAMRAAGTVFVDRGNRAQSIAALENAKAQLRAGTSIWIAPEGTRSRDGQLGPLKKGGFHLARSLGVPIAPAWIEGTAQIITPGSFAVTLGGHVTVRYGEPISTTDVDDAGLAALMERVREALLALQRESVARRASGA